MPPVGEAPATAAAAAVDSEENPFDEKVYRSSTRDAEIEIAGANPIVATNPFARFASNKRNLAIAAGAVVLLVVALVFALGGDKPSSSKQASKTAKKTEKKAVQPAKDETPNADEGSSAVGAPDGTETPDETPTEATGETPSETATPGETGKTPGEASGETPAETGDKPIKPDDTPIKPDDKPIKPDDKPIKPADKPKGATIGGKPVVLDYDTQAREAKPVAGFAKEDQAAIQKARTSYAAGNQKLFAGDADSAIKNYRQALAYYPAYVAGYRGLGLAYAQKGDKGAAVRALRVYVSNAPRAKDAALIRKRIETLSK